MAKGKAPTTGVDNTRGLLILVAVVVVLLAGIVIANNSGVFSGGVSTGNYCDESVDMSTFLRYHEHSMIYLYLDDSGVPFDFSPERYQLSAQFVHFENGAGDANGGQFHTHALRPSIGCMFETFNWKVSDAGLITDVADGQYLVDDENVFTLEVTDSDGEVRDFSDPWYTYQPREGDVMVVRYGPPTTA